MNAPEMPLILIGGQTAVGKSEVAIKLARAINGEIISVDSMQVYREMDIGTAKPSLEDRAIVPHHLIDVVDVTEPFDAAKFVKLAQEAVIDIKKRGKNVIMCGGTGLYFKAFLEGLGEAPPADPALRAELEATPTEQLLAELEIKDPEMFKVIDKYNRRRIIRAIEVIRLTGKHFSELRARKTDSRISIVKNYIFFGLRRSSTDLRKRINERVDRMFKLGLVEETKQLIERGIEKNPTAMQAIGYKQVIEYLKNKRSLSETVELIKTRTYQYARRQITWFKNQANVEWIELAENSEPEFIVKQIMEKVTHCD